MTQGPCDYRLFFKKMKKENKINEKSRRNEQLTEHLVPKCSLYKFSSAQLLIKAILEMIKCFSPLFCTLSFSLSLYLCLIL